MIPILTGEKDNITWSTDNPNDDSGDAKELPVEEVAKYGEAGEESALAEDCSDIVGASELLELCLSIQEAITNLFGLSKIIRKRYEKGE